MNKYRKIFGVLLATLILGCLFAFGGCKPEEEPEQQEPEPNWMEIYSGTYYVDKASVNIAGASLELALGKESLLGLFTKDLVTLTLTQEGNMTFHANIFEAIKFDLTGTWDIDETDKTKVNLRIEGESQYLITTCDGEHISVEYQGNSFAMTK